jgi:hypothetical protein
LKEKKPALSLITFSLTLDDRITRRRKLLTTTMKKGLIENYKDVLISFHLLLDSHFVS